MCVCVCVCARKVFDVTENRRIIADQDEEYENSLQIDQQKVGYSIK